MGNEYADAFNFGLEKGSTPCVRLSEYLQKAASRER